MTRSSLRSDAAENRERLIESAREVFQLHGIEAPLEAVATRAGVSRATLYRHFATREELASSVFSRSVELIEARAFDMSTDDEAAVILFHDVLRMQMADRGLARVLTDTRRADLRLLGARVEAAFRPLVERGVASGHVRQDVDATDVMMCFSMAAGAMWDNPALGDDGRSRLAALLHRALFPAA